MKKKNKTPKTSYEPGQFAENLKEKFIFWSLAGKTVVEMRCHGAHRNCMWLMHRFKGNSGLDEARDLERVVLFGDSFTSSSSVLLFFLAVVVKELLKMLLEVTFWPLSTFVHLLDTGLLLLPSSFHHRLSLGVAFMRVGPTGGATTEKRDYCTPKKKKRIKPITV